MLKGTCASFVRRRLVALRPILRRALLTKLPPTYFYHTLVRWSSLLWAYEHKKMVRPLIGKDCGRNLRQNAFVRVFSKRRFSFFQTILRDAHDGSGCFPNLINYWHVNATRICFVRNFNIVANYHFFVPLPIMIISGLEAPDLI